MGIYANGYDLVQWYWDIQVQDSDSVSINKYLINHPSDELSAKQAKITQIYLDATAKQLFPRSVPFGRAKIGKATPEDFEYILSLGVTSGYFKKLKTSPQKWADENLGIDCTGFVIAYYDYISQLSIDKSPYSGGVGCPWLLDKARRNKDPRMTDVLIWNFDDIQEDDMILWMYASGKESKSPGHISIIYDTNASTKTLYCAESNGSIDKSGHSGPRITQRIWSGVKGSGGGQYIELDKGAVVIVRPPDSFP
jgi:hypothetical protein